MKPAARRSKKPATKPSTQEDSSKRMVHDCDLEGRLDNLDLGRDSTEVDDEADPPLNPPSASYEEEVRKLKAKLAEQEAAVKLAQEREEAAATKLA